MDFLLNRFTQDGNIRRYVFQAIADDRKTRTELILGVDLVLVHKYKIPLQEVPLLCRLLLVSRAGQFPSMLTENDIRVRAAERDQAEVLRKQRSSGWQPRRS